MESNIDYQDYQDNYKRYFSSLSCEQVQVENLKK